MENFDFTIATFFFFKNFLVLFIVLYGYSIFTRNDWSFVDYAKYAAIVALLITSAAGVKGNLESPAKVKKEMEEVLAAIKNHKEEASLLFLIIEDPDEGYKKARSILNLYETDPARAQEILAKVKEREKKWVKSP